MGGAAGVALAETLAVVSQSRQGFDVARHQKLLSRYAAVTRQAGSSSTPDAKATLPQPRLGEAHRRFGAAQFSPASAEAFGLRRPTDGSVFG